MKITSYNYNVAWGRTLEGEKLLLIETAWFITVYDLPGLENFRKIDKRRWGPFIWNLRVRDVNRGKLVF